MPFNGNGTFTPLAPPQYPAVEGEVIRAAYFNAVIEDLLDGLTNCLARDGQAAPLANLPLAGFKFTGVGNATADDQFAAYGQLLGIMTTAYFKQAGTGAVNRIAQDKMRETVTLGDFNVVGDGVTLNTTTGPAAFAALTTGMRLVVEPGVYLLPAITLTTNDVEIVMKPGAELKFPTLGVAVSALTISADKVTIRGGKLTGPTTAGTYVANENGIKMLGASTSSRRQKLVLDGVAISKFGAHGVYAQFVDNIFLSHETKIFDCGYAGAMFLSCNNGQCFADIDNIGPGTSSNMYGVSLTHYSTGYSSDGSAGTKQAAHPFCWNWIIGGTVSRVNWEGIDTHGAYEVSVIGAKVYATKKGISLTASSGDAANYAGWSNAAIGCLVDGRHRDGTTSGYENTDNGITVNGAATATNRRVVVAGNTVLYKGIKLNTNSGAITATRAANAVISGNIIDYWNGNALNATGVSGIISGNIFGRLAQSGDTSASCVLDDNPALATGPLLLSGNLHNAEGGTASVYGFKQIANSSYRPSLTGNDFTAATYPINLGTSGFIRGSDMPMSLTYSSGVGGAVDIAQLGGANGVVRLTSSSTYTITNFTNGQEGQIITLSQEGAGTVTINRDHARLAGGASQSLTQFDIMALKYSGGEWWQCAPVSANS